MSIMTPRSIAIAILAALGGCGVVEDDRPTVVKAAAPVARNVIVQDLPPLAPAPSAAAPADRAPADRSAMGYGSTYGSTYSGASQGRYGAAYEDDGVVVSYGYGGSSLYRDAYRYRMPYAYGFRSYAYPLPYGAYPYRYPSLYGYGYGHGFGFYRGGLRPVAPIEKDKFVIQAGSEEEAFAALDRVMQDQGYVLRHERPNGQRVYVGRDRIKGNDVFYVARLNVDENRRGFAVKLKESIRPRDPTKHDGVGRLYGHRAARALEDESSSLRKQLKRGTSAPSSAGIGLAPSKGIATLSTPTNVTKVKPSRTMNFEPQRKSVIVKPRNDTLFLSPRRTENLSTIQAPMRRSEGGSFRQTSGSKRKGGSKLMPLP